MIVIYRKRAAAKQLIEAYYFQLTDGCGNSKCANETCASSSSFKLKDKDRNALALMSIELFKQKAQLCENKKNKIARLPVSGENSPTEAMSTGATPLTSPDKGSVFLPGPSTASVLSAGILSGPSSSKATGATSKYSPSTSTRMSFIIFIRAVRNYTILSQFPLDKGKIWYLQFVKYIVFHLHIMVILHCKKK